MSGKFISVHRRGGYYPPAFFVRLSPQSLCDNSPCVKGNDRIAPIAVFISQTAVITVRKYQLKSEDVVMTSDPSNNKGNDLFDDSEYDVFGK